MGVDVSGGGVSGGADEAVTRAEQGARAREASHAERSRERERERGRERETKRQTTHLDPLGGQRRPRQVDRGRVLEDDQARRHARRRVVHHAEVAAAGLHRRQGPHAAARHVDKSVVELEWQAAHAVGGQAQLRLAAAAERAELVLHVLPASDEPRFAHCPLSRPLSRLARRTCAFGHGTARSRTDSQQCTDIFSSSW